MVYLYHSWNILLDTYFFGNYALTCVYQENTSESQDIPRYMYTNQKQFTTSGRNS